MGRPRHSSRQIDRLLAAFMRDPGMWRYGYELAKDAGIPTGTLYPALLRLADDDYLEDHWELPDDRGGRVRRMYRLTPAGIEVAFTPLGFFSSVSTFAPVWIVMPCFSKDFIAKAETSSSSTGRMRSMISTTVTFTPSAL